MSHGKCKDILCVLSMFRRPSKSFAEFGQIIEKMFKKIAKPRDTLTDTRELFA